MLNKGVVDHMFEKHYESEESDEDVLVDQNYVKEKDLIKDRERSVGDPESGPNDKEKKMKKYYHEEGSDEDRMDDDLKKFRRKKRNLVFKKRVLRDEKLAAYTKIMLLIKLRVLQGPLFIYSMLECIRIKKQIFILELEQGREVCVPYHLSVKHLPLSF